MTTEKDNARVKAWCEANREKRLEIQRRYREKNKAKTSEYARRPEVKARRAAAYAANPEKFRARSVVNRQKFKGYYAEYWAEYQRRNKGKVRARACVHRSYLKKATPPWANREEIRKVYASAFERGMHVDHVIPLRGKNVSGLHVETNLQLLTPLENRKKSNLFSEYTNG